MGFDLRRVLGGIPVLGPFEKSIFGDPDEENLQNQIKRMQQAYQQYRPEIAQSRMQGLGNQLSVYGPVNDMLRRMYGPQAQIDTSKLMQNPLANIFAKPPAQAPKPPGHVYPPGVNPYPSDNPLINSSIEPNVKGPIGV